MTIIKIDDEIGYWGISASSISRQLDEASGDITIEISSPGGAVFEGITIFNAIKAYNKGHVTTTITSLAASMASVIALAGDTVKAYDNAVYMIHNASMMAWGDANFFRKKADHLESLSNLMANIYIAKSGKSESEIKQLLDDETFFYGVEMKEAGFIDEIISSDIGGDSESAKALANESFMSCMKHYRENAKDEEYEQVAAFLKDENLGVNLASAQIKNQKEDNSMNYNKETFDKMQTDHAEALEKATVGVTASQTAERERCSQILALSGNQEVKLSAISEGLSVGDTAIKLLSAQTTTLEKAKTDFEEASEELKGQKDPDAKDELSADDEAWAKAEKEKYGEKK